MSIFLPVPNILLKVLSYWNLNTVLWNQPNAYISLKVLSYWNLNVEDYPKINKDYHLKYYHIGI